MHEVITRTKRIGVKKDDATAQPVDQAIAA
jgi:hypothetical protein